MLWFGALWPRSAEFDATSVLEAWRPFGVVQFAAATIVLLALLASDRAADAVARAASAVFGRIPSRARIPLLVAVATTAFATLTDVSLSGDALDIVRRTATHGPPAADPLTAAIHGLLHHGLSADAYQSVRWTSVVAGAVFVALAAVAGRDAFEDAPRRVASAALLLGAAPVALFFGSVETYAPVDAATLAFLLTGLRRLDGRGAPWLPPLLAGVAVSLHGSAAFLAPAAGLLLLHERRAGLPLPGTLLWIVAGAAPVAGTAAAMHVLGRSATGPGFGAGEGLLLPLLHGPEHILHRYALLDAEHLVAAASVVFVCGPAAWALLAAGPAQFRGRRDVLFLAAAAAPLLLLPFVWNTSYTLRRDWDLFSLAGVPLALLAARAGLFARDTARDAVRVAAIAAFAAVPFVLSHHGGVREQRRHAVAVRYVLRATGADSATLTDWSARVAALDPDGLVPRVERVLTEAGGRDEKLLRGLLAQEPDDPYVLTRLGELLVSQRRFDEAEPLLRSALLEPRENLRPPARHALAELLLQTRRVPEARAQLERLVREDSEHPLAGPAVERLAEIAEGAGDDALAQIYRGIRATMRRP